MRRNAAAEPRLSCDCPSGRFDRKQFQESAFADLDLEHLWEHSKCVGAYARRIAKEEKRDRQTIEQCLLAGLLHDIGMLVMAVNMPEQYFQVFTLAIEGKMMLHEAERQTFGTTHAEVGAYLLGLWGFQEAIVKALAFHHNPSNVLAHEFCPLSAVHFADVLDAQQAGKRWEYPLAQLDLEHLEQLGLSSRLDAWHEACLANPTEDGD